jgi:hypothetical protein
LLGQRAEREQGLKGAAFLPLADERAVLLQHGAVGVPRDVRLELAGLALDHERVRLPVRIEPRLGDPACRGAP